jgi:UDP-N-acetylglucosamine--N-acetylmuramyl-(pentapeptide) pyrophosphoryl-undecaprenol N-acetylglucosamine transferase
VPVIIHEQNAVAGTANRLLVPMSSRVCEAFPETFAVSDKLRSTGNPVRPELFTLAPRAALEGRKARLLVLGGSLGAEPLNKLLPEALAKVPAQVRPEVFHQAGKQHDQITAERYAAAGVEAQVQPFIKDMAQAYGWADMVVCRAGALTVSELAAAGLPSLLVPLPHAIDDHQSRNADFLAREGAAFLMPQATTGAAELAARLTEVLMQPERLNSMATNARRLAKPDATRNVVDICLEVANG